MPAGHVTVTCAVYTFGLLEPSDSSFICKYADFKTEITTNILS